MQNNGNIIELLSKEEIKNFIDGNLEHDVSDLALKLKREDYSFPISGVLELIALYQKAKFKLPHFVEARAVLDKKSYEQSSSEITALRKAEFVSGAGMLNLCGGLGVDDWAFSRFVDKVISVEKDARIHEYAAYNLRVLGCTNVERKNMAAEDFLEKNTETFSWIYADPDRRTEGMRVSDLSDSAPDIPALWPVLRKISANIMVKASPMTSVFDVVQTLPGVNQVVVMALKNEVKEVLFISEQGKEAEVTHTAINIVDEGEMYFSGLPSATPVSVVGREGYFYEANLAMIKSGLAGTYAATAGTKSLIPGASYQFSQALVPGFQGRSFRIVATEKYSRKSFDRYLKSAGIKKANFSRRNFRQTVEELRKFHRIADGGNDYFFFYQDLHDESVMVHAGPINTQD